MVKENRVRILIELINALESLEHGSLSESEVCESFSQWLMSVSVSLEGAGMGEEL
jgi:hypothetical protein